VLRGKDLVADEAADLLAQEQKLIGKLEPGKAVHCGEVKTTGGERRKAGSLAPCGLIQKNRLESARRQLETAITIYFTEGDPVSITL
jgi:hypothetical protein